MAVLCVRHALCCRDQEVLCMLSAVHWALQDVSSLDSGSHPSKDAAGCLQSPHHRGRHHQLCKHCRAHMRSTAG